MFAQKMFANFLSNFELLRTSNLRCKNAIFRTQTKYPSPPPGALGAEDGGGGEEATSIQEGAGVKSRDWTTIRFTNEYNCYDKSRNIRSEIQFQKMPSFRQKMRFFLASVPSSYCPTFPPSVSRL